MTFRPGYLTAVYLDRMDASPFLNTADRAHTLSTADVSHFGSNAKNFIAGVHDHTVGLGGMYDGTPLPGGVGVSADQYLTNLIGTANPFPVTLMFDGGLAVGKVAYLVQGLLTNYTPTAPVAGVETIKVDIQGSGGAPSGVNRGVAIADTTSVAQGATQNFASVDNAASSANGGYATVHVIANTLNVASTVHVQHSSDNVTFVDLVTQTVPAGTTAGYILSVAGGTTVNRYVRAQTVASVGTGAVTAVVAFARG